MTFQELILSLERIFMEPVDFIEIKPRSEIIFVDSYLLYLNLLKMLFMFMEIVVILILFFLI